MRNLINGIGVLFVIFLLSGCGGPSPEDQIPDRLVGAKSAIDNLSDALSRGDIRNALILKEYAKVIEQQRPELSTLTRGLSRDATTNGALFKGLTERLVTAKQQPKSFATPTVRLIEVESIIEAARPDQFNMALTDVVNVIADLSNGTLARVESLSKNKSLRSNNSKDLGAGSQLMGNPSYGRWQTGSGGTSFWAWYGMYSMFGNLVGGRQYGYSYWNRHRDYSYYNDVGRSSYGRTSQRNSKFAPTSQKTGRGWTGSQRKSYGNASARRRASTYSRKSSKSSSFSKKSRGFGSSFRSSYSRGGFGGK